VLPIIAVPATGYPDGRSSLFRIDVASYTHAAYFEVLP
jgi:hypothetical protein